MSNLGLIGEGYLSVLHDEEILDVFLRHPLNVFSHDVLDKLVQIRDVFDSTPAR